MKNIIKIMTGIAAAAFLAVSCNVDNIGAVYTPEVDGVTFLTGVASATEIPATENTFSVTIARGIAKGSLTVALKCTLPAGVTGPSSVTFADGEYSTTVDLDVTGMVIGKPYKGTIAIDDKEVIAEEASISTVSLELQKAYIWERLGTGKYYDSFLLSAYPDLNIQDVEVVKAQGFNLYRMYNPLPKAAVAKKWSSMVCAKALPYIEFTIDAKGHVAYGNYVNTGYTTGGDSLYYCDPDWFEEDGEEYNCTLENGTVVQFYWYQYTSGGSWWDKAYPAYLAMPSFKGDFEAWLLGD